MKEIAEIITKYLSSTLEVIAALVVGISLLKFLYKYFFHIFKPNDGITNQTIRIQFGSGLTVALELLLAADILATAIAPTWDEIGKLAAIASLRTALNYFLEREYFIGSAKITCHFTCAYHTCPALTTGGINCITCNIMISYLVVE